MSEVEIQNGWKILLEFSLGPSLMALAHAFSERKKGETDRSIFCKDAIGKKVFFFILSPFKRVTVRSSKGQDVDVVECQVSRCEDRKNGTLVFLAGHRHATFIEKIKEDISEEVIDHLALFS